MTRFRRSPFSSLLPATLIVAAVISTRSFAADPEEPRTIEVVAKRYAFEPAVIEVAIGEPVRLLVRSADGVHGLEIKKFKVKKEIPRGGEAVVIDFTPKTAGRFPILCSEYCGDNHDEMKGTLVVQAREGQSVKEE